MDRVLRSRMKRATLCACWAKASGGQGASGAVVHFFHQLGAQRLLQAQTFGDHGVQPMAGIHGLNLVQIGLGVFPAGIDGDGCIDHLGQTTQGHRYVLREADGLSTQNLGQSVQKSITHVRALIGAFASFHPVLGLKMTA